MSRSMKWGIFLLLVLGLVLCGWAFYVEPSSLVVRSYPLSLPQWNENNLPLRVVLLGDLHVGSPFNTLGKLEEIVETTNRSQPDLVLLAGDYVIQGVLGGSRVTPRETAPILARLSARAGVYAVLGNHDHWWGAEQVGRELEEVGIAVLEDEAVHLVRPGLDLWLVGISDYWEGDHDVEGALSKVPPDSPVIAFTHNPDIFPEMPVRVDLTLAGHTHGGQVAFPFIGPPIVPSVFGRRYASGIIEERGHYLFVTPGLGTSILPVRFGVPPEISILDIR